MRNRRTCRSSWQSTRDVYKRQGEDVIRQVAGKTGGEEVLFLSRCCFKENDTSMLDDVTLEELSAALGKPCAKLDNDGYMLISAFVQ